MPVAARSSSVLRIEPGPTGIPVASASRFIWLKLPSTPAASTVAASPSESRNATLATVSAAASDPWAASTKATSSRPPSSRGSIVGSVIDRGFQTIPLNQPAGDWPAQQPTRDQAESSKGNTDRFCKRGRRSSATGF